MLKSIKILIVTFLLFISTGSVWAIPNLSTAQLSTPGTQRVLLLPEQADSSDVISLGIATDPQTGKLVEGFAIIHPKRGYHHLPGHSRGPGGGIKTSKCYSFLANGAKWKTVESWIINPSNIDGLDTTFVFDNQSLNISKWEDAADGVVGNSVSINILGDGSITSNPLVADTSSPDGQNETYFADVSTPGAIAVTIVWGIFSGPPSQRELVEWDQVYDDVDFDWSSTGESSKMDFENVSTHEDGHGVGLGHPDDSCTEETMYRFSSAGETKKRDLHTGDIAGVNQLY